MPVSPSDFTELPFQPSWNQEGGKWYVTQTTPRNGESWKMYRHKPNLHVLCHSLSGSLTLSERLQIYREALEVIAVFKDYNDLRILAVYRRCITQRGGVPLDVIFFNLALDAQLSQTSWEELAERMPEKAPIREACYRRARFKSRQAAE